MYIFYVIYFYSFLYYFSSSAFLDLIWLSFYQSVSQFSCSVISDFVTPWTAAHQASLSITNSQSLLRLMTIESMLPSNHLILCHPLLLLPSIFASIRVSSLHRVAKYWSFSISPSNKYPELISFRIDWLISLQSKGLSRVFSNTTVQMHQFFSAQLSSQSSSHPYMTRGKTIALTRHTFVGKVMSLLLNMLSRLVITFLPRSKHL